MKTRAQIESLLTEVLSLVPGTEAAASYGGSERLNTRFGDNAVTQNMAAADESLRLTVSLGRRQGSAVTNALDSAALKRLADEALALTRVAPEDPEWVEAPGPQVYPAVPQRFFEATAALSPADLGRWVEAAVARARARGCVASGLASRSVSAHGLANTNGLFAHDLSSDASFSVTMHGARGSGSESCGSENVAMLDPEAAAADALQTALAAQDPAPVEPGDYTVVFEPEAVAEFLAFLFWNLDARDADEGSTALAGRVGTTICSEKISLVTRLDDPELPASAIGNDGLAARPVEWVQNGVLRRLWHDRWWARQKGTEADPTFYPLTVPGGSGSVEDLVRQCSNGLLVKRLWYIRYVDQRALLLTGMSRDGLFRIRDGAVAGPVRNLRFNESPLVFLHNVLALGAAKRVGGVKVPAILSDGFTFSSTTESV